MRYRTQVYNQEKGQTQTKKTGQNKTVTAGNPHSPLGQDFSLDALVDDDPDGVLGHVEHSASLAMVALVDEALLECPVALPNNTTMSG